MDPTEIFFRARLVPNHSLSRAAFRRIMLITVAASLTISTGFYLAGAWPVFGFLGLDILGVWLALRASYRAGRRSETVELNARALVVEREGDPGRAGRWSFEPAWLRVVSPDPRRPGAPILLRSHGKSFPIASFLGAEERMAVAHDLRHALDEWRSRRFLSI